MLCCAASAPALTGICLADVIQLRIVDLMMPCVVELLFVLLLLGSIVLLKYTALNQIVDKCSLL